MDSGVLQVLDRPISTMSARWRLWGACPSSFLTRELDRLDATKILLVELVLNARREERLGLEEGGKANEQPADQIRDLHPHVAGEPLDVVAMLGVDDGVDDKCAVLGGPFEDLPNLDLGSDAREDLGLDLDPSGTGSGPRS